MGPESNPHIRLLQRLAVERCRDLMDIKSSELLTWIDHHPRSVRRRGVAKRKVRNDRNVTLAPSRR